LSEPELEGNCVLGLPDWFADLGLGEV
jgi:hypothetical protein